MEAQWQLPRCCMSGPAVSSPFFLPAPFFCWWLSRPYAARWYESPSRILRNSAARRNVRRNDGNDKMLRLEEDVSSALRSSSSTDRRFPLSMAATRRYTARDRPRVAAYPRAWSVPTMMPWPSGDRRRGWANMEDTMRATGSAIPGAICAVSLLRSASIRLRNTIPTCTPSSTGTRTRAAPVIVVGRSSANKTSVYCRTSKRGILFGTKKEDTTKNTLRTHGVLLRFFLSLFIMDYQHFKRDCRQFSHTCSFYGVGDILYMREG